MVKLRTYQVLFVDCLHSRRKDIKQPVCFLPISRDNEFYTSQFTKHHKVEIWFRLLSVLHQSKRSCVYTSAHNVKWRNLKSHYVLFVIHFKFEKQLFAKKFFWSFIRHVGSYIFSRNLLCKTVSSQFINQVNYRGLWVLLATHSGYSALILGYSLQKCLLDNPCWSAAEGILEKTSRQLCKSRFTKQREHMEVFLRILLNIYHWIY